MPLWVKILSTVLLCIVLPTYARFWGWANFLWFSDIALILTVVAMWTDSRLIVSMVAVGALIPELAWNVAFFSRLIAGVDPLGMTNYMFDSSRPLWVRGLSLFHIVLPPLLVWMLWRMGYDRRALPAQTALAWVVLLLTWLLTNPRQNINWAFGWTDEPQTVMPPLLYLLLVMAMFPLVIYWPTHLILNRLFGR